MRTLFHTSSMAGLLKVIMIYYYVSISYMTLICYSIY